MIPDLYGLQSLKVIKDRWHVVRWNSHGTKAWVFDAAAGCVRRWSLGFTLKAWSCWITGETIPENGLALPGDGWAWRYNNPDYGGYIPGYDGYFPGEEQIRVARHVFAPDNDELATFR